MATSALFYVRKLYALLRETSTLTAPSRANLVLKALGVTPEWLPTIQNLEEDLETWWQNEGSIAGAIASSSDRINLSERPSAQALEVRHPISGQSQPLNQAGPISLTVLNNQIQEAMKICYLPGQPEESLKRAYWWCWRFYPEIRESPATALLNPAHHSLPDCPLPSYNASTSALVGSLFPDEGDQEHPYLLLITLSPVQDFIKASRKFIDFWASSYLLHYLSARLCWKIAQEYGPDAVITPSLWGQEIIDAFIAEEFQFHSFFNNQDPAKLFNEQYSTALSTAGFPNVITALIPGKARAIALGKMLKETLQKEWETIAYKVRDTVKKTIIDWANNDSKRQKFWDKYKASFPSLDPCPFQKELAQLKQGGCWEWNNLWEAQIKHTWEFYFVAVPLGSPEKPLTFSLKQSENELQSWSQAQEKIAKSPAHPIPLDCEKALYQESQIGMLNVGSWWGNFQTQLARMIQAIKNTRSWQIPVAPGERSSISGLYSALHFRFQYQGKFQQGRGLPAGSIRLFWLVMAENFPGLFNGSERLNAIELTKRMAWSYGGVTEMLGINSLLNTNPSEHQSADYDEQGQIITPLPDYEAMIRFPNLCSIAAARVMHDYPNLVKRYCNCLLETLKQETILSKQDLKLFQNYTSRPSKIWQVDQTGQRFNGVMFSSKWLADNIGLDGEKQVLPKDADIRKDKLQALRLAVDKAHTTIGFDKDSPADWWALVLGDGDSMGKYVSGSRLKRYANYLVPDAIAIEHQQNEHWQELLNIKKRMGPATHVGLNRALLDFSNRLVPYLTEKRCCGRVIFSGGDDVMVALPVIELPKFLASLRAAWCGEADPIQKFETNPSIKFTDQGGFWTPNHPVDNIKRPFFTMGEGATMSLGIVIAHKSVPLPTVLESIWSAEKERSKQMTGAGPERCQRFNESLNIENEEILKQKLAPKQGIPYKDGICFRVIYGSGNTLESLMKGHLLESWWDFIKVCLVPTTAVNSKPDSKPYQSNIGPLLHRLAEVLSQHGLVTEQTLLIQKATEIVLMHRDEQLDEDTCQALITWLNQWETWAWLTTQDVLEKQDLDGAQPLGTRIEDLVRLLRFSAFMVERLEQHQTWQKLESQFH